MRIVFSFSQENSASVGNVRRVLGRFPRASGLQAVLENYRDPTAFHFKVSTVSFSLLYFFKSYYSAAVVYLSGLRRPCYLNSKSGIWVVKSKKKIKAPISSNYNNLVNVNSCPIFNCPYQLDLISLKYQIAHWSHITRLLS